MRANAWAVVLCWLAACLPARGQTVSATQPLSFGSLAAGTGGTVTVDTNGARSRLGGVVLVSSNAGAPAQLSFTASAGTPYVVTLPPLGALSGPSGSSMALAAFTASPLAGLGTGSPQILKVGATLTVGSGQLPGDYSGQFTVTVSY